MLGMCPTLAISTSAFNGLGMGLAATIVLVCSNALVSLLRKVIPDKVRIPAYVLIIATFVTLVEMLTKKSEITPARQTPASLRTVIMPMMPA